MSLISFLCCFNIVYLLFKIVSQVVRHFDRWFACLLEAPSPQASRYLLGVSGCSIREITSPVMWQGGIHVGKGKGYSCACAANTIPSQNRTNSFIFLVDFVAVIEIEMNENKRMNEKCDEILIALSTC